MANTKKLKTASVAGLPRPDVTVGPADPVRARIARKAVGAGGFMGRSREAGMLIDTSQVAAPYSTGYKLEAYRTSYAYGLSDRTGAYDIPTYFVEMNEKNGGMLYWPVTLHEKYSWFRYWSRTDAYIGRALELLSDLPMSKLTLNMPKMPEDKKELGQEILNFFTYQMETINAFEMCQSTLWELNMIGNCFPADHLIHTDAGMLPICQIRDGDRVLTASGRYRDVLRVARRYVSEWLIDLDISRLSGLEFTPTSEHPVLLLRDGKEVMVKAKEVVAGDYVGIAFNDEVEDVETRSIPDEIGGILTGRYDKVSVSSDDNLHVSVEYTAPSSRSHTADEIKDKILSWLATLDGEVDMTCDDLSLKLGVYDVAKLRSVAYLMRKRGIINTKRIGAGKNGSSIRWSPLLEKPDLSDFYGRTFNKEFVSRFKELEVDEDFLYLLGYWLGDGWLWEYKRPTSYQYSAFDICAQKGTSQCDRLKDSMTSVFGDGNFDVGSSPIFDDDGMFHVSVTDPILCAWWGHHFGARCETKKLPQWVMLLPPEKQIWVLRGMIDSDGSVSYRENGTTTVSLVNTNLALMHQLFQIGIRCGIPFRFEKNNTKESALAGLGGNAKNYKPMYSLVISDNEISRRLISGCVKNVETPDVKNSDDGATYICRDGRFYFRVANAGRRYYEGFVYNFSVEEDHTYCVNQVRTHNCYWFLEWDDKKKMWSRAVMLPPEEVYVFQYPFTDNKRVEYRPQRLISLIKAQGEAGDGAASEVPKGDYDRSSMNQKIVDGVPDELKDMVLKEGCIVMDTDPLTGSFVHHIARRRSPYMDLGSSVLERVLVPMLQKEHYRYTQLSLASRNMTPKNLITAPGLMPEELDDLRTQVDLSYLDPEYSVITNYEVTWQQIGVQERFLDFSREYEQIENQVFAALGVTRELLTGEGQFSGTKITVEILNTMFLLTREILKNFLEKQLFIPVCEAHGWFSEDKNGAKKYWCPQIGFNRLTIRDNAEVFDSLFQLYAKGSLPVEVIYELFNLNAEEMHTKMLTGLFTAKDATFNRMAEEVNVEIGRALVQQTDILEKVAKYLGLQFRGPPDQQGGGEGGGTDGGTVPQEDQGQEQGEDQGQEQKPEGEEAEGGGSDPDALAKAVADSLPPDASDDDIGEGIDEATKGEGK